MNTKTSGLLVFALIIVVGVGIFTYSNGRNKSMNPSPALEPKKEMIKVSYKDGVYTNSGDYTSPAGPEQIEVKLTLKNGIVVESEVTPMASHPISKAKQEGFAKEYKSVVVGKNIKDLVIGKTAGASLTPKGFNDAVEKIKGQAKS